MDRTLTPARVWDGLEIVMTGLVLVVGAAEIVNGVFATSPIWPLLLVLSMAVATATSRRLPSVALAMAWVVFVIQLQGVEVMWVQLAVAFIAFGCARWGSLPTLVASFLSAPAAGAILLLMLDLGSQAADLVRQSGFSQILYPMRRPGSLSVSVVLFVLAISAPWLAGIALRFAARARTSETSRRHAEELAALRESQAQLARDVHDVVGHSLTVILAQAEAGQFTEENDELKRTLATIATSARTSLRDVRQVLAEGEADLRDADLEALVDGVRASGHEVVVDRHGSSRPLPPDLAGVAYRVMQEMLTNAMNHGERTAPIWVEQRWDDELRLETSNTVRSDADTAGSGRGIPGMRRRLESVGGRLDVRRPLGEATFVVTAWVPVRPVTR